MYGWGSLPRGWGFTYYDLLDQAGRETCDSRDFACVARNQERVNSVQDLWTTQYMADSANADRPAPKISIALDTSDAAYRNFLNNQALTTETISVNGGPAVSDAQLESGYFTPKAAGPAAAPQQLDRLGVTVRANPIVGTKLPVDTFAISNAPVPGALVDAGGPSMWSAIPWWGWLAGAGGLAYAFRGSR